MQPIITPKEKIHLTENKEDITSEYSSLLVQEEEDNTAYVEFLNKIQNIIEEYQLPPLILSHFQLNSPYAKGKVFYCN